MKEWRRELRLLLDFIENELQFREGIQQNLDMLANDQRLKASQIVFLEREIERLKRKYSEHYPKENGDDVVAPDEVSRMRRPVTSVDTTQLMNEIRAKVPAYSPENVMASKLANLNFEVKQMKNTVCEAEDKCNRMEDMLLAAKQLVAETRQQLSDLQIHLKMQKKMSAIQNTRGHLIWRIDNFAAKMKDAKENDTVLKSPLFCNRQYGYTLRVIVKDTFDTEDIFSIFFYCIFH